MIDASAYLCQHPLYPQSEKDRMTEKHTRTTPQANFASQILANLAVATSSPASIARVTLAAAALLLTVAPAFAQTPTPDQRGACGADYQKYCTGTQPGGGRVVACLNGHRDQLSAACKKAIDSRKQ